MLNVKERRRFDQSLEGFNALRKHLREQHGMESFTKSQRATLQLEEATWIEGESRVTLHVLGIVGKADLSITYQSAGDKMKLSREDLLTGAKTSASEQAAIIVEFRKDAEEGDADAQLSLASLLLTGQGGLRTPKTTEWMRNLDRFLSTGQCGYESAEAVEWIRKAADQSQPRAQYLLGLMFFGGSAGLPKDKAKGAEWLGKSADQGEAVAQNALGMMYERGEGMPRDYAQAVKWYGKAAEQGLSLAQNSLGRCLEQGRGVETNLVQAAEWYRKAAEKDFSTAQINLANCYRDGIGVGKDPVEAYAWYGVAFRKDDGAFFERDAVARTMTPEQIAAGKKRTEALRAQFLRWAKLGRPVSGSAPP
jgi:TPR repeat protein